MTMDNSQILIELGKALGRIEALEKRLKELEDKEPNVVYVPYYTYPYTITYNTGNYTPTSPVGGYVNP